MAAIFIILAILTVSALVAWNMVTTRQNATGEQALVTPTPESTPMAGSALGRTIGELTGMNATPAPTIATNDSTKGGVVTSIKPVPTSTTIGTMQYNRMMVAYTSQGFTPRTVTINRGTMVMFKNESNNGMWVITDDHSAHQKLPELNMHRAVGIGGSYEFEFTTSGTYTYHNESLPQHTGTIVVQ